jgi:hypothetical protein
MESTPNSRDLQQGDRPRVRAILFSNFPMDVFTTSLKPKFEEYGIDIVRVVSIDRTKKPNLSDCDVVLCMVELMSGGQRDKCKEAARSFSKKCIGLSRKGGTWDRELASVVSQFGLQRMSRQVLQTRETSTRLRVVPPAPESVPSTIVEEEQPEIPEPTIEDIQKLLMMFEEENQKLEEQKCELIERLKKSDALAGGLERQLERQRQEEEKSTEEFRREATALIERVSSVHVVIEAKDKELEQIRTSLAFVNNEFSNHIQQHTTFRTWCEQNHSMADLHQQMVTSLQGEREEALAYIRALEVKVTELESVPGPTPIASDVERALEPMKQLWKMGFLSAEEVLKKLFKE